MVRAVNENAYMPALDRILTYLVKNHQTDRSANLITIEYVKDLDSIVIENNRGRMTVYYRDITDPYFDHIPVYSLIDMYDETYLFNRSDELIDKLEKDIDIMIHY